MTILLTLAVFAVPAAHAQDDPLPATGLVEVLPVGDVVTDGVTPVTVHVLALRSDGTPMDDLSVKIKSKEAVDLGPWTYVGDGIYSFELTPARVDTPSRAFFRLRGRTDDKAFKVDLRGAVPLLAPRGGGISMSANPSELLAGERDEATLSIQLAEGSDLDPETLQIRTSVGEVGEVVAMGGGRYVARLDVQRVRDPGLALITLSDARFPDRRYASLTVPVTVKRDLRLRAPSRSSVIVRVADREFGPAEARGGWAKVPGVVLPPGRSDAVQVTVVEGVPEESEIDLGLKPVRRVLWVPPPSSIPADPTVQASLRVLVVAADGQPDPSANLTVTTDLGEVTQVSHEGGGIYRISLKPARAVTGTTGTVRVEIEGERGQHDEIELATTGVRAASVALEADPDPLGDTRQATLTAQVFDSAGEPLVGRAVDWNLVGAKAVGAPRVQADGRVEQPIQTLGGPVEAHVTGLTPPSRSPARSVVIIPGRSWIPGDAISSARLLVIALDGFGYPVADARFGLQVVSGDGTLPAEVVTDARGIGEVFYTAGRSLRLVQVRAHQPGMSGVAAFLQGPAALDGVVVPASGTPAMKERAEAWARVAVKRRIELE